MPTDLWQHEQMKSCYSRRGAKFSETHRKRAIGVCARSGCSSRPTGQIANPFPGPARPPRHAHHHAGETSVGRTHTTVCTAR